MQSNRWLGLLVAFVSGVIFALGLGFSGMTQPTKVLGFLDVAGKWDATLLVVLGAATGSTMLFFQIVLRKSQPFLAPKFFLPTRKEIDWRLVFGAVLFGVGWGLGGFCPGPAIASVASGLSGVFLFIFAMATGNVLWAFFDRWLTQKKASKSA